MVILIDKDNHSLNYIKSITLIINIRLSITISVTSISITKYYV